uniref:TAR DNA-binding protein 43 N-terminal domain-containing protein n=1 Tax=Meloidogyne incognita TaxID=6306 RepID=A0A914MXJ2_MELIC
MSEQRFVKVREDEEIVGVPLSPTGELSLQMLKIAFPRAYGLKYTNQIVPTGPNAPAKYLVYFDGKEFFSDPIAEWNGIFEVMCTPPPPSPPRRSISVY